jgi:hypothetical protein
MRRDLIGVDGRSLLVSQPGGGEDLLDHRVLPLAVLVDVGGGGTDPPLDGGVPHPQVRIRPQDVPDSEVVTERQRTLHDDIRVRSGQPAGLFEGPPLRDAEFAEDLEPEPGQGLRRRSHVRPGHHDVAVDDRLGGKTGNRGAADVLDGHHRHAGGGQRRGVLVPQPLEPLRPGRVVLVYYDHA